MILPDFACPLCGATLEHQEGSIEIPAGYLNNEYVSGMQAPVGLLACPRCEFCIETVRVEEVKP